MNSPASGVKRLGQTFASGAVAAAANLHTATPALQAQGVHDLTGAGLKRARLTGVPAKDSSGVSEQSAKSLAALTPSKRMATMFPLSRYFGGLNPTPDLTKMKRSLTLAKSSNTKEEELNIMTKYIDCVGCATEMVFTKMIETEPKTTLGYLEVLCGEKAPGQDGIPKTNFSAWCMRMALVHLPPLKMNFDFPSFLNHAGLMEESADRPLSLETPSHSCAYFQESDRQHGEAAQTFCNIIESHVLKPLLEGDMAKMQPVLLKVLIAFKKYFDTLPEKFVSDSAPLSDFLSKLKGLLFLSVTKPYDHGASIDGVSVLDKGNSPVCLSVKRKESRWKRLLDGAWMLHMKEMQAWPDINDQLGVLTSLNARSAKEIDGAIQRCIEKYHYWKKQVRVSALTDYLHPALVEALTHRVDNHKSSPDAQELQDDPKNADLKLVLGEVREVSKLWADIRVHSLLKRLQIFSGKVDSVELVGKLRLVFEGMPAESEAWKELSAFQKSVTDQYVAIPDASTTVCLTGKNDQKLVAATMSRVSAHALVHWNADIDNLVALLKAFKAQIEFPHEATSGEDEVSKNYTLALHNASLYISTDCLKKVVNKFEALGSVPQARYDAQGSYGLIQEVLAANKSHAEMEKACAELGNIDDKKYEDMKVRASKMCEDYRSTFVLCGEEALTQQLTRLQDLGGGAPGGEKWSSLLPTGKRLLLTELGVLTRDTLQRLDPDLVSSLMRSVVDVFP